EHSLGHTLLDRGEHEVSKFGLGKRDVLVNTEVHSVSASFLDRSVGSGEQATSNGEDNVSASGEEVSRDRLSNRGVSEVTNELVGQHVYRHAVVLSPLQCTVAETDHEVGNCGDVLTTVGSKNLGLAVVSGKVAGEEAGLSHRVLNCLEVSVALAPAVDPGVLLVGVSAQRGVQRALPREVEANGEGDVAVCAESSG